jgi:hypothetical protein
LLWKENLETLGIQLHATGRLILMPIIMKYAKLLQQPSQRLICVYRAVLVLLPALPASLPILA